MVKGLRPASRSHSPAPMVARPASSRTATRPRFQSRGSSRGSSASSVVTISPMRNQPATTGSTGMAPISAPFSSQTPTAERYHKAPPITPSMETKAQPALQRVSRRRNPSRGSSDTVSRVNMPAMAVPARVRITAEGQ